MTNEAPMQRPLVRLPSGAILRPDLIAAIARKELDKYTAFFHQVPIQMDLSLQDIDILLEYGLIQSLTPAATSPAVVAA